MAHTLGANLSITNMKTFFPHPCDPTKFVNCIIDPCHALKLVRNAWSSMRVIYDVDNNKIDWGYIEKLVTLQENEGFHAGNKLKRRHLEWKQSPMKVNIAAQTLSSSVADAIDFCRHLNIKGFEDSEATTQFIQTVDKWFDILNSRNPHGCDYKSPLRSTNVDQRTKELDIITNYILKITWGSGKGLMVEHPKKTGFIGKIKKYIIPL